MRRLMPAAFAAACCSLALSPLQAQTPTQGAPVEGAPVEGATAEAPDVPAIPAPRDEAYPGGTMTLAIDATDVQRGLYRVTQTIPLPSGTLPGGERRITLLFPEWLPGHHAPRGPIAELADIRFSVDGAPVGWRRDPLDVYAFHVDLPAGARVLTARFVHTSPLASSEGRVTMTTQMLNLQWEKMSFYPAGYYTRRIPVKPTVTLPVGWTAATALDGAARSGNTVSWAATDYETLVDSPIFAGAHFRKWDLGAAVNLNVVADEPEQLALAPENLAFLSALVDQTLRTFGAAPFKEYEFLVALSSAIGGIGLEHLESSENQLEPGNFIQWNAYDFDRNVLAHELVHSWNGKYRRPARLWAPDFRQPTDDSLLWVYEGQTQFWGWVLAARSGLQRKETVLGMMAQAAGSLAELPGRAWRPLVDTTLDPIIAARKPKPYSSLARSEDYYNEGALIWLEVDQIIRNGTRGARGLDDFARRFFAYRGDGRISLYDFDDVVAALDAVHPHDWAGFLRARVDRPGQPAPLAGVDLGGYRLVWKEEPNPYARARADQFRTLDLAHSLGISVSDDGSVSGTVWDGPAFAAGLVTGARIVAVDGMAYTRDGITVAIARAAKDRIPIDLLVRRGDRFDTISIPYYRGLRWPWLERANARQEGGLDRLLAPRR